MNKDIDFFYLRIVTEGHLHILRSLSYFVKAIEYYPYREVIIASRTTNLKNSNFYFFYIFDINEHEDCIWYSTVKYQS